MYLVDTNVWLERLLDQERSEDVRRFLAATASERLFITDFTLHSIGVVLIRLNKMEGLLRFVRDAFLDGAVALIHLEPGDTEYIVRVAERFNLDFDDAYQYTAAEKYDLTLVSFDSDFDRTERGRKNPGRGVARMRVVVQQLGKRERQLRRTILVIRSKDRYHDPAPSRWRCDPHIPL
jgi:uncharacterized protein